MKKKDVDKRINFLKEELQRLKKARNKLGVDENSLLGKVGKVIARHIHADIPENIATRECIYDPIMEELRPLLCASKRKGLVC